MEVLFVLLFSFAYANAYVIETIGRPSVTVLDYPMETCGLAPIIDYRCSPVIDYGYRTLEPFCGLAPVIDYGCAPVVEYGYRTLEHSCGLAPVIDYGCSPIINYGYRAIEPPCGCASVIDNCGCRLIEQAYPVLNRCDSMYQGFSPILDTGLAFSYADAPGYGLWSPCGATIPPLPPVIGCPKYLRQITVPPPFL